MHFQNDMDICEQIEMTTAANHASLCQQHQGFRIPLLEHTIAGSNYSKWNSWYGKYFCTSVSARHPRLEKQKRCADRMLIRLEVESPSTKRIMPDFAKTQSSSKCESFTAAVSILFFSCNYILEILQFWSSLFRLFSSIKEAIWKLLWKPK